ncbi:MAG: ATP-dependent DNA ligase [Candidatus Norongarragalinales archaeon]
MDFSRLAEIFEKLSSTTKRLEITDDIARLLSECSKKEVKQVVYLITGVLVPQHYGIELGMGDKLCVQSISLVSGKTPKEVETHYRKSGDLGDTAQELLKTKTQHKLGASKLSTEKVYENFYKIATSTGSGSQELKIKLLADLLGNATPLEAKYIIRFVTGKLRLGAGEATVIDALSFTQTKDKSLRPELERAYNFTSDLGLIAELFFESGIEGLKHIKASPFSPIQPALAERLGTAEEIIEKIGECAVEAKYDGFRLQVHKQNEKIEIYSRRLEKMTHMFPDLYEEFKKNKSKEFIIEGEAIAFDEKTKKFLPFQATIQRKRKHGIEEKARVLPLKFFVFDVLLLDGKDYTNAPYAERRKTIDRFFGTGKTVVPSQYVIAKTPQKLQEFFEEVVGEGLEGIIAKDLTAPYTAGARKFAWIKLKKSYGKGLGDTVDGVIVGYYLGKGKRTKFGFGGLLTAIYDESKKRFRTICKIGTGFSEEQMQWFEKTLSKIALKEKPANVDALIDADVWVVPKYVVEINADEITRSPVHTAAMHGKEGLALRFPRLVKIREDKNPAQATTEKEIEELYEMQRSG